MEGNYFLARHRVPSVCVCVCVHMGDWAFEGESRLLGVIMRTNAELYCHQDAYDVVSKRDEQYAENLHCGSYLYFFSRLFNVIAASGDTEEAARKRMMHDQGHELALCPRHHDYM